MTTAATLGAGVGAEPGDVILSIGTSGIVSTVADTPAVDPSGTVAGYADMTGRFLPLVCTLNAARVLDAATTMLRVDHSELSALALSAPPGTDGLVLVPYLEGERTPTVRTQRATQNLRPQPRKDHGTGQQLTRSRGRLTSPNPG